MHINPNIEKPIFIQIAEQLEDSIFTKCVSMKKQKSLRQMNSPLY